MTLREATRSFQRDFIAEILERNEGNACATARELGIHRNSIHRYVEILGIDLGDFRRERRKKNAALNAYQRQTRQALERAVDPEFMREYKSGSVYFRSPAPAKKSKVDRMLELASCRRHA